MKSFLTLYEISPFAKTKKKLQQQTEKLALVRGLLISIINVTEDVI